MEMIHGMLNLLRSHAITKSSDEPNSYVVGVSAWYPPGVHSGQLDKRSILTQFVLIHINLYLLLVPPLMLAMIVPHRTPIVPTNNTGIQVIIKYHCTGELMATQDWYPSYCGALSRHEIAQECWSWQGHDEVMVIAVIP